MQSTEEYLDQLLASVSDEESKSDTEIKQSKAHRKSIEELDESELTEETLQQQLALLLGLEIENDDELSDEPADDDFMSQYTAQLTENEMGISDFEVPAEEAIASEPIATPQTLAAVAEPKVEESVEVPVSEPVTSAPATSNTGVLSPDEIAALFASMEAEAEPEPANKTEPQEVAEEVVAAPEVKTETVVPAPMTSDSGVLSPDEIAALFASMGAEENTSETVETETASEETDMTDEALFDVAQPEDSALAGNGSLTREELEELGLGDIADVLVDGEEEILTAADAQNLFAQAEGSELPGMDEGGQEESQIVEIPELDFGEEMLLELENVDAMLEATAKLAEEESERADVGAQAEEDIMSMLTQFEEESITESIVAQEESAKAAEIAVNMALEPEEGIPAELLDAENDGKKKRKKVKKEKVKKEKPVKEKKDKASLKDKIAAFMFEDESLEDEKIPIGEGDELAYMDLPLDEKPAPKKKEKAAKKNKKAKKSNAEGKAKDENAEIAAELAAEDKKKAKKKDKPKKEKKAKKVVISEKNPVEKEAEKREAKRSIGAKGIAATLLVCASLLGLILVGTYFLPKQLSLMSARVAFYAQNYEETAMRMMGRDLNDSDQIMYEKASLLYGLEERYHQAEIYIKRGMDKEALNALLQGVVACNKEEVLANQLGIEMEWALVKDQFIKALQEQYDLDAETVEAICALRNPDYTVAVENILAGRRYDDRSAYGGNSTESVVSGDGADAENSTGGVDAVEQAPGMLNTEELEDLLPEEEAIIEQLQQENAQPAVEEQEPAETGDNELYSGTVESGEVNFVE